MFGCRSGFIGVRGKCFYISRSYANYENSLKHCKTIGANLAKVDRQYVRNGLIPYLYRYRYYWIGLKKHNKWYGPDGSPLPINSTSWETTYPYVSIHPSKSILENVGENPRYTGGVCQKHGRKFFFYKLQAVYVKFIHQGALIRGALFCFLPSIFKKKSKILREGAQNKEWFSICFGTFSSLMQTVQSAISVIYC